MKWWATVDVVGTKRLWRGRKPPEKSYLGMWWRYNASGPQLLIEGSEWIGNNLCHHLLPENLKRGECVELEPPERFKIKA